MRHFGRRLTFAITGMAALLTMSALPVVQAAANSATGGNGLRVSKVRNDITVKPGDHTTVSITVTNVTNSPATLQAIVNDFIANPDESGAPTLLLNNQFAPNHSLKRFIQPISNFTLQPNQSTTIPVSINVPKGTAGGGYYGVVRFASASTSNKSQVNVAGSVGSLILLTVPGKLVEKLSIASFDARVNDRPNSFFTNRHGINAVLRMQNEGNIQEAPFGKILLKNRSGKVLATYEINAATPPGNVLPDSVRKFAIPLGNKVGNIGQFKLEGNFGYGSSGQLLSASTTFYVIPVWLI